MEVLIAGGTGLIGSALSESLWNAGHQISIISRTPRVIAEPYTGVSWEEESLLRALSDADAVVNLAGESLAGNNILKMRWTARRQKRIISSRTDTGRTLQSAILKSNQRPGVFIQASAIGFYGNTGSGQVDESFPAGDDFLSKVCLAWEDSTDGLEEIGVRRNVIRIGLVLSRNGGLLPLLALPHRLFVGGPLSTGTQFMSWIHLDDVVGSIQFLLENPDQHGTYNLTSPSPRTNREFSKILSEVLDRPSWFPVPAFALELALGEAATLALDGRSVYPARLKEAGYQFTYTDLKPALQDLMGQ